MKYQSFLYNFQKLNEPIRKAIYNKKIAPKGKKPNFYTMKEGVEKIRKVCTFTLESASFTFL